MPEGAFILPRAGVCHECGGTGSSHWKGCKSNRVEPLSDKELDNLARYNAERSRGLMHTLEWHQAMIKLQQRFDSTGR